MSWVYESFMTSSEVNPEIRCLRVFGRWNVIVSGTGQTSGYLNQFWRKGLRHFIPRNAHVRRILILGFGTGGAFPEFYRRFRDAKIVTVEIDPKMVELAKRFNQIGGYPWPEVHVGPAVEVLPSLQGQFDLIVSDMFLGPDVAPQTVDPKLLEEISRLLSPKGHLLVNTYDQPELMEKIRHSFVEAGRKKYISNWMGYFRPHGVGILGDWLPEKYVPFMSCPEFLQREYSDFPGFEAVRAGKVWGARKRIGSLVIERYLDTREPEILPDPTIPVRFVIWDQILPTKKPQGWHRMPFGEWRKLTGYVDLDKTKGDPRTWTELAQRDLKKWQKQTDFILKEINVENYCDAYRHSDKRSSLVSIFSETIRHKVVVHGSRMHLWGIVSRTGGEVVAGFAALDVPETNASLHVSSFILPTGRSSGAGVAMVNQWFQSCLSQGIRYADFDGFYAPGEPKSWQGFSRFKSQFGTQFIAYPKPYCKFVRSKQ